jgi:hypothetical protein
MKSEIPLILSTIVLTVLIWYYADRTSHAVTTVSVPVRVTSTDASSRYSFEVVDPLEGSPDTKQIDVTLRGPKRAIHELRLRSEMGFAGFNVALKIPPGEITTGRQSRNLFPVLNDAPEFKGLTVEDVVPETIRFNVERYLEVPVDVKPLAGGFSSQLVSKPVVIEDVSARVLASQVGSDFSRLELNLPIEDAIREALDAQQNEDEGPLLLNLDVPLQPAAPAGMEPIFSPESVHVTVQLEENSTVVRKSVLLSVMVSAHELWDGYEILWEDETGAQLIVTIEVRVPVAKVERFERLKKNDIMAFVVIDHSDLPQPTSPTATAPEGRETFRHKPVYFKFPEGFEDVVVVSPPKTVGVRVQASPDLLNLPTQ